MKAIPEEKFVATLSEMGLALDPRYPEARELHYPDETHSRFWITPTDARRSPCFISTLLALLGDWRTCFAWRPTGSWGDPRDTELQRPDYSVEQCIFRGLGIVVGSADVLAFDRSEIDKLVTLLFDTSIFGWSIGEDTYVIPDHGRAFLKVSHHDVVHATVRSEADIDGCVATMSQAGFELPVDPPDATFKRPTWMPPE
jgi:hypothetical protein